MTKKVSSQPQIILEEELKILLPNQLNTKSIIKKIFHNWWLLVVKWVFMIMFGAIAFLFPELTLLVLLWYLAVIIIIIWSTLLVGSIGHIHDNKHWFLWVIEWLLDIWIWMLVIFNPNITLQLIILFISIRAAVKWILYIIHAWKLKKYIPIFITNALLLIIFAFVLFFNPLEWAIAMTYLLAAFAIIFGFWVIYLGFQLKKLEHNGDKIPLEK